MIPAIERFLEKISVADNGCWEWLGAKSRGYGTLRLNNKTILAHRFIYEYYNGSICPDLTIDHLCRNRACCNPLHLEQITSRLNILRGIGIAAINFRKTHCPKGHEYTEENTYISPNKKRSCLTCLKHQGKEYREKNTDKIKIYQKIYNAKNKDQIKTYQKLYRNRKRVLS